MGEQTWERGKGYTERVPAVPTVLIESRPPPQPLPGYRGSGRGRPVEARIVRGLWTLVIVLAGLLLAGGLVLVARETSERVDQQRIERWENRLDALDGTAVQLFDPGLSGAEKQALELRLEHLQRSWCSDVERHLDEVPGHLEDAYGQVCEGG